jgi:nucleotide-binding universal stress UspA family protein
MRAAGWGAWSRGADSRSGDRSEATGRSTSIAAWWDFARVLPAFYTPVVPSDKDAPFELGTDGPRSILVGVDDSTTAARAGWYAAGLARRQGARVTAVFVARLPVGLAAGGSAQEGFPWEAEEQIAGEARRWVEEVCQELGVPITFVAASGDPFTELCRIAEDIRADAVVVGASAHAGHRLVGSLAVRLVKAARWPVTVVP